MNLHAKLLEREISGRPVTVGLIGAGKFGTMFMAQARLTQGMHLAGVADLDVARARSQLKTAGWPDPAYAAGSLGDAHKKRATFVTDSAEALIADPKIEVIVEATGVPGAGIHHALSAIANGKHIVMSKLAYGPRVIEYMIRIGWHHPAKLLIYPIRNNVDGEGRQLVNWVCDIETPQYQARDWNRRGRLEDFLPAMQKQTCQQPQFLAKSDQAVASASSSTT